MVRAAQAYRQAMATCPECGAGLAEGGRFCASCGAPVDKPRSERRKIVTVLFSDLTGSTQLGERHDAETVRRVLSRYFDEFSSVLVRHGGAVEKFVGDAVLAVFGIPTTHEDDALRAVRAAVEMRTALDALNDELEPRYGVRLANHTGINTGEVVTGFGAQRLATGDAVNVAARLEQAAEPGEILLGAATESLVRGSVEAELLPPLELKGKSEPVTAWRLVALGPDTSRRPRRLDTPLVGRDAELGVLLAALDEAEAERECRRALVIGPPGIGKSRLMVELERRAAHRATVLSARCLHYGEGITFWPLAQVVRAAAAIDDDTPRDDALRRLAALVAGEPDGELVASRVSAAIGLAEGAGPPEETAWAARRLFESLARERPLVVAFDDLHWAEPTFLALLDSVAATSRAPILLLTGARPELLESRPRPGGTTVHLDPLEPADTERLIDFAGGDEPLPADLRDRVRATAEGNPLFVEETIAMLREQPTDMTIPPTIQALLAARLDTLPPDELDVLVRASVVGQEISRAALVELSDDAPTLDSTLAALERKDLLVRTSATYSGDAYRFWHVLVRDAAYAASLKEVRADLHERFARWLARTTGNRLPEYEEIVGYHLEQAHRLRVDIAPGDPAAEQLAADAGHALGNAGRRAIARGDMHAAGDLLARAAALEPGRPTRAELLTFLAEARLHSGDLEGCIAAATEAAVEAEGVDRAVELRATLRLSQAKLYGTPDADHERILREAEAAAGELEALGDLWGAAEAWLLLLYRAMDRSYEELIRVTDTARVLARRAGNTRTEAEALTWLGTGIALGPMPVGEGLAVCERLVAEATGPLAVAHALLPTLWLYALAGRIDDARDAGERAARTFADLGLEYWVYAVALSRSWVERLAGARDREEKLLRDAVTGLKAIGDTLFLSTYASELALTLAETGRVDEALELADLGRRIMTPGDLATEIGWRLARAEALVTRSELDEAEQLAREAVDFAFGTDGPFYRSGALVVLAHALRAAGRDAEADAEGERALAELRRKGSELAVEQARRRLELVPSAS